MLVRKPGDTYERIYETFRWQIPDEFNIGHACSDAQPPLGLALVEASATGDLREFTFGQMAEFSNRFANALRALGVQRGDRIGIVLPQRVETGIAHLAAYKVGAVAVPMSRLFGPEALRYRLGDCGAGVVIVAAAQLDQVLEATQDLDDVIVVVVDDEVAAPCISFWQTLRSGASTLGVAPTTSGDPALLIYTSGTTGPPKGALHAHRALLGHVPGFQLMYDFFGDIDDRIWTPADWAWIGGLMDALLPAWFLGRPAVAADRQGFDPEWAVDLMVEEQVTNAFLPPTALKLLRQSEVRTSNLSLRSVMSGGEPLGQEMLAWAESALGVVVNEIYGQTEANLVVGNCSSVWPVKPGSMGRPYPGHAVEVLSSDGTVADPGKTGHIAVRAPDPVMFLEYWGRPDATAEKVPGDWLMTGDLGHRDEDGYLWFKSRDDDIINSAGYRIGPGEVEDSLVGHPAVAMAAVIGVPDDTRGEKVKAYVKLAAGVPVTSTLDDEIRDFVRTRLSAHEYPREIEFVTELPLTTTGKVRRTELRAWHAAKSAQSASGNLNQPTPEKGA